MKIIHTADLHLDSGMETNMSPEKARQRKSELIETFRRMVRYARENGVSAILISGDLFDKKVVSRTTINLVTAIIREYSEITFFYLRGNHDDMSFTTYIDEVPANIVTFDNSWKTVFIGENVIDAAGGTDNEYTGDVVSEVVRDEEDFVSPVDFAGVAGTRRIAVTAAEINSESNEAFYDSLVLDANIFNIVMLHGQESQLHIHDDVNSQISGFGDSPESSESFGNSGSSGTSDSSDNRRRRREKTEIIPMRNLQNKNIDYLALGHIHSFKFEDLDARGKYCYPGCLEGRGFDEAGDHGFVLLDINEEDFSYEASFISFASRKIFKEEVDVSGIATTAEAMDIIDSWISHCGINPVDLSESFMEIVLTGQVDINLELDTEYLTHAFENRFFVFKVKDNTQVFVDYQAYAHDMSLKGEFVRLVNSDESLSDEDKAQIIKTGIDLLRGNR